MLWRLIKFSLLCSSFIIIDTNSLFGAYTYYYQIDLPTPASTLTDTTVTVCANTTLGNGNACDTVSGLNQSGGGAHVTQADGDDIAFGDAGNGTCGTKYNWDTLELYTAATGALIAHVGKVTLSSGGGNKIFICYGDSSVTTFQGGSTGAAWDTATKAVYHLATLTADSSSNGNTLTNNNTVTNVAAMFNNGANFVGASSQSLTRASAVVTAAPFTLSCWFRTSDTTNHSAIFGVQRGSTIDETHIIEINSTGNSKLEFITNIQGTGTDEATATTNYSSNTWTYATAVVASATSRTIYKNATDSATGTTNLTPSVLDTTNLGVWNNAGSLIRYFTGDLDECRIANVARSVDWITRDYNNQSNPATYLTFGSETPISADGISGLTLRGVK